MIYVIADDLTGANDTGVQFSKQGFKTVVFIVSDASDFLGGNERICETVEVVVVDTETREVDAITARNKIKAVLRKLNLNSDDIVYKKIDSTLRGSIGVEIEEIMLALQKGICIFTPSYPFYHRAAIDGYLIVNNYSPRLDRLDNDKPSRNPLYIPSLLEKQTRLPILRIGLEDVAMGAEAILERLRQFSGSERKIVVVDAVEERHLESIVASALSCERSVLICGSAGPAKYLSDYLSFRERRCAKSTLIVCGSRNPVMQGQVNFLNLATGIFIIDIDLEKIYSGEEKALKHYLTESLNILEDKKYLVIRPDIKYRAKSSVGEIMAKHGVSFRELELTIRDFLGKLTAMIMERNPVKNIILVGGDTARGVCLALGIDRLLILDELMPGIPLSVSETGKYAGLRIVTKAGAFGGEDTLYQVLLRLLHYQGLEVRS